MGKALIIQDVAARVPPGQILTDKFPVLTYGATPRFDPKTWDFKVVGLVEKALRFSYEEFRALRQSREVADFHCVTTWSRLDNAWEGVKVADLMKLVKLSPEVRHVIVHCDGDYTTNLPLGEFLDDDVMLAHRHDGRDLRARSRISAAADRAEAILVEERQVGARDRVRRPRPARILGSARIP